MGKYSAARSEAITPYKIYRIAALAPTMTPIGNGVATTSSSAITGGGAISTVTPASMSNIVIGKKLIISGGTGTPLSEVVTVTSVSPTTFSAAFQLARTGAWTIGSMGGSAIGPLLIGKAGDATSVLTLYDGNPNINQPNTNSVPVGTSIAVLTNPTVGGAYPFGGICDNGLFYTYTGSTAGELILHALDLSPNVT